MPQTRSATRARRPASGTTTPVPSANRKRRASSPSPSRARSHRSTKRPSALQTRSSPVPASATIVPPPPLQGQTEQQQPVIPATLSFAFDDAKTHLTAVDPRFGELFRRLKCKPFEHLDQVNPFRSLVQSILGQQISWRAARSVAYKFIRLYDPSLPEKPNEGDFLQVKLPGAFFPVPYRVANTEIATLRSAGLSMRKAEYVQDLASRFSDGRLSTAKLLDANDEELVEILTQVRGVGKWTVDMFAIFTLRRPDILPVGDIGVQKGMIRWFGGADVNVRSETNPNPVKDEDENEANGGAPPSNVKPGEEDVDTLSTPQGDSNNMVVDIQEGRGAGDVLQDDARNQIDDSTVPEDLSSGVPARPFHATSSSTPVLEGVADISDGSLKPWTKPLPQGLTPAIMKNRLEGKKVKGAFLSPLEMEALALEWAPYRSLATYYMWALTG